MRWANVNFNTVAAAAFVVLSVVLFVIIPHQIDEPLIALGQDENSLEASLFPGIVAAGFLILGMWFFVKSFSLGEANNLRSLERSAVINVVVTLAAMAVYGPAMMVLGVVVASAIIIAFLSTFYGNRNYALTAVVSVAVPVAIFFAFTKLLATSLPPFPIDTVLTRYFIL